MLHLKELHRNVNGPIPLNQLTAIPDMILFYLSLKHCYNLLPIHLLSLRKLKSIFSFSKTRFGKELRFSAEA